MISPKIYNNLEVWKKYIIYDAIYAYTLVKTSSGAHIISELDKENGVFIIKSHGTEDLIAMSLVGSIHSSVPFNGFETMCFWGNSEGFENKMLNGFRRQEYKNQHIMQHK